MSVTNSSPADPSVSSLSDRHRKMLEDESGIAPEVISQRNYTTFTWTSESDWAFKQLTRLKFSKATRPSVGSGLFIPIYGPDGQMVSCQFRPDFETAGRKYVNPWGSRTYLDINPEMIQHCSDVQTPLVITEGIKKGDSFTTRGQFTVALSGVDNWQRHGKAHPEWDQITLEGRDVTICYDADVQNNDQVKGAMLRLGTWLESKNVRTVKYLIVPSQFRGVNTKGADDYFAAGGTLQELLSHATETAPLRQVKDDELTDSGMAVKIVNEMMSGRFCWTSAAGWLRYTGTHWKRCAEPEVREAIRVYSAEEFSRVSAEYAKGQAQKAVVDLWYGMLSVRRVQAIMTMAQGMVIEQLEDFDQQHELLNTPSGVVDLVTGRLMEHNPDYLMMRITNAEYEPGKTHPMWDKALEAIPEDVREWAQSRYGQAITGYTPNDDLFIVQHGGGANGKTTLIDAIGAAIGPYHTMVSDKALLGNPNDHTTELMDLMGARFARIEETAESRRLDTNKMKKVVGGEYMKARYTHKDNVEFRTTHSLFISTNYKPIVNETDHGTWRRLALLSFPFKFVGSVEECKGEWDRVGDPTLRFRLKDDPEISKAILAWLVEGAVRWFAANRQFPKTPKRVLDDTEAWKQESDITLMYISQRLVFANGHNISSKDLYENFNDWLDNRGFRKWNEITFWQKFGANTFFTEHDLKKSKVSKKAGTSRPHGNVDALPARFLGVEGLRFRTAADDEDEINNED